jgi:negative regulator of sigma-B (phosphoserine phosphatase)
MESAEGQLIDWGVATLTFPGQADCGDRYVVKRLPDGVLVAAVDGLGHGADAAVAAEKAVTTVLESSDDESLLELLGRCHENLRATRGVVLSLASFNARDNTLAWLGVGNVEGRLRRAEARPPLRDEALLLRGGVVGGQLSKPRAAAAPAVVPVMPGDTLVLATDGIRSDFATALRADEPPQRMADRILAQYCRSTDDALVLVARYRGAGA